MYPTMVQRDDRELKRRILHSLYQRGLDRLEQLEMSVTGGVVTFRGRFKSSVIRQRSIDCCRHVAAVIRVIDDTDGGEEP